VSHIVCQHQAMKLMQRLQNRLNHGGKIIQQFGQAKLIRQPAGQHELIGGTPEDRANARDYIAFFQHELVVTNLR